MKTQFISLLIALLAGLLPLQAQQVSISSPELLQTRN